MTTTSPTTSGLSLPTSTSGASRLLDRAIRTTADTTPLVARVALGAVMFPHGAQKALGWFGGYGLSGTMGFFTGQMGIPAPFAAAAIAAEFLGAIGLVTGTLSRVAAFGIACVMAVAVLTVHLKAGFFMNGPIHRHYSKTMALPQLLWSTTHLMVVQRPGYRTANRPADVLC